jgi:hypothetical protein
MSDEDDVLVCWIAVANCSSPLASRLRSEEFQSLEIEGVIFFQATVPLLAELMWLNRHAGGKPLGYVLKSSNHPFVAEYIFGLTRVDAKPRLSLYPPPVVTRHTLPK